MTTGLHVDDVSVFYGKRAVVDHVTLSVGRGEWLGIVGPNGAGKSTLLKAIGGVIPIEGSVTWEGADLSRVNRRRRARIVATVPQQPVVPDAMPVLDYVLLGRTPHIGYWSAESPHDILVARTVMATVDLAGFDDRPLGSLSGGERQRVVLARALAQEPELVLLDEPTAALDLGHQQHVLEHVDRLRAESGLTVLSALHDLTLASQYPDRLVVLDRGKVAAAGAPADVLTPETVEGLFGATVSIVADGSGGLVVAPRRSARQVPTKVSKATPIQ